MGHSHDLLPFFWDHQAQTSESPYGIHLARAEGSILWDIEGNTYIDLISGISSANVGHRHPKVLKAIQEQLDKYLHTMVYGEYIQDAQLELIKTLVEILPSELDNCYLVNSGAESVEAALKLAKRVTGKSKIVSFKGSYHGNTHGAMSVSANESKKSSFRPLLPDIEFITFNNIDELTLIDAKTAAVIIEPVQGDAGVRISNLEFMRSLKNRCNQMGALLIFDEIQCGLGRTGKMFAFEHHNLTPDILCLAKSLGAGLPIGAMISSKTLMSSLTNDPPLGHITTFGGNPVSCASSKAGLEVLIHEIDLVEVEEKGKYIKQKLKHDLIREVRQVGLMLAVDLPNEETLAQLIEYCKKNGVILYRFLSHPYSFRISPPLNIEKEQLDKGLSVILNGLNEILNTPQ